MQRVRGYTVYRQSLFDEETLAYILDLADAAEAMRVKRNKHVEDGDTEKVQQCEALRNNYITRMQELLRELKK